MHKISEDFGTTESVKFVTFARLLRSLVWINVASSLEVFFLHLGVVSLTDEDAQGVPQVAELGDLLKEVTDKSIRPTQEFEGQNKSIKSKMWYLFWKHKMLQMSTREQCQVRTRAKEKTGKKHDMGYSCF
ncbi:hypothetical protein ACFX15_022568 [Malus domestica]